MTDTPTPPEQVETTDAAELLKRARATEHRGRFNLDGGTLTIDGKGTSWGGEKIMDLRNPDGPALARCIETLIAKLSASEAEVARKDAALEWWDRQATSWLNSREEYARPGWMQPAISKGRHALKPATKRTDDDPSTCR